MAGLLAGQQPTPEQAPAPPAEQAPAEQAPEGMDKVLQQAMGFVRRVLYEGEGADSAAQVLKDAKDKPYQLARLAYDLAAKADEKTDGNVSDRDLGKLGMFALDEVAQVADAAGVKLSPAEIGKATELMITKFVQDSGGDPAQLKQAMSAVPAEEFNAFAQQAVQGGKPQ